MARGQISITDPALLGKRRRDAEEREPKRTRGTVSGARGRGRGRGEFDETRATDSGWGRGIGRGRGGSAVGHAKTVTPALVSHDSENESTSESDSDGGPEVVSIKRAADEIDHVVDDTSNTQEKAVDPIPSTRHHPTRRTGPTPQPKQPTHNPFASRPTLLRNVRCYSLLAHELKLTTSASY